MVQLTKYSIGLNDGLAPNRRQVIIGTNADPVHRRMYAALGGDELTHGLSGDFNEILHKQFSC